MEGKLKLSIATLAGLLCAIVLLVCTLPTDCLVFADEPQTSSEATISSATFTLKAPNELKDSYSANPEDYIQVSDTAPYTIASVENKWFNADGTPTGDGTHNFSVYLQPGVRYAVKFKLAPKAPASFASDVKVTGNDGVGIVSQELDKDGKLDIVANIKSESVRRDNIEKISFTVKAPKPGTIVKNACHSKDGVVTLNDPSGEHIGWPQELTFPALSWYHLDSRKALQPTDTLKSGETYRLAIKVVSSDVYHRFTNKGDQATKLVLSGDGKVTDFGISSQENYSYGTIEVELTIGSERMVSFDTHGRFATPEAQRVTVGGHAKRPDAPAPGDRASDYDTTGLTFSMWATCDASKLTAKSATELSTKGGAKFDFDGEAINDSTTLHAIYQAPLKTVVYDVTTGDHVGGSVKSEGLTNEISSGDARSVSAIAGAQVSVEAKADRNVEFIGWSTSTSTSDIVSDSSRYDFTFSGRTTLYALFKTRTIDVVLRASDIKSRNTFRSMTLTLPYGSSFDDLPQSEKDKVIACFGTGDYVVGKKGDVVLTPLPVSAYKDWDDVERDNQAKKAITRSEAFYIPLNTRVNKVDLTLDAPVSGTTVENSKFTQQSNAPKVTMATDAPYQGDTVSSQFAYWTKSATDSSNFQGTFVDGQIAHAYIRLQPKFGYCMDKSFTQVSVNGTDPEYWYERAGADKIAFSVAIKTKPEKVPVKGEGHTVTVCLDGHGKDLVISHVQDGTKVRDFLESLPTASLVDDGYCFVAFAEKNVNGYTSMDELGQAVDELYDSKITSDMTINTVWFKEVSAISGSIASPHSGTEIKTEKGPDGEFLPTQTNQPELTSDEQSHFTTSFEGTNMAFWGAFDEDRPISFDSLIPANGTFEAGSEQPFVAYLFADFGYIFTLNDKDSVAIEGAQDVDFVGNYFNRDLLIINNESGSRRDTKTRRSSVILLKGTVFVYGDAGPDVDPEDDYPVEPEELPEGQTEEQLGKKPDDASTKKVKKPELIASDDPKKLAAAITTQHASKSAAEKDAPKQDAAAKALPKTSDDNAAPALALAFAVSGALCLIASQAVKKN